MQAKSERFSPYFLGSKAISQFSATLPLGNKLCLKLLHFHLWNWDFAFKTYRYVLEAIHSNNGLFCKLNSGTKCLEPFRDISCCLMVIILHSISYGNGNRSTLYIFPMHIEHFECLCDFYVNSDFINCASCRAI